MAEYRYRIGELKIRVGDDIECIPALIEKKCGLRAGELSERVLFSRELKAGRWMIRRESVDARDKSDIRLVYTVDISLSHEIKGMRSKEKRGKVKISDLNDDGRGLRIAAAGKSTGETHEQVLAGGRPVVVGFGPCGIFAALELAEKGLAPIVVERGSRMEKRISDVENFQRRDEPLLNPESNVLFGEGGAGTFSDGKLTSGIKDDNLRYVLETFYRAGADEKILYAHRPHIGTDVLRRVVVNIRRRIESMGGELRFDTRLDGIELEGGAVRGVTVCGANPDEGGRTGKYRIETGAVILAPGHSARDTFSMLKESGVYMEQKPFSIGVRIEHPQELIDRAQYGDEDRLPPAEYKLSYRASSGRGVYSFCMCPGGEVIVCATRGGELCVNGMSRHDRDSGTANSGILCDVRCEDFGSDDVLAGVRFQERYEALAFANGGGNFCPPKCGMKDFLECSPLSLPVASSLPSFAADAIREAVPAFADKIHGYDSDDAVVTAVETRSSSPIRITRDENGFAGSFDVSAGGGEGRESIIGLYPAGEGAGYAGGITSAACDGIRAAGRLMNSGLMRIKR